MTKHALLVLALLLPLGGCDEDPQLEPLADFPQPALRPVMFEIDALNWGIEPILRDASQAAAVASAARSMQNWARDEAWTLYYDDPRFLGDRQKYDTYWSWLQAGLEQLASSAEASDLDGMRAGFIRTQQSCTACHKRFNPNI